MSEVPKKKTFDWTQRIERDADQIEIIIMDEHAFGCGYHSQEDFAKIRGILQKLASDVEIGTRQEMENKVITLTQKEVQ